MDASKVVSNQTHTIKIKEPFNLKNVSKRSLADYFKDTWKLNEILFSSIKSEETFYLNPDPLRNPLIFYWGHTAVFYINKLRLAGLLQKTINPDFEQLYAVGVDPDSADELENGQLWASLADLDNYRNAVFETVLEVIEKFSEGSQINQKSPWWALIMAFEHERIHFETSSVLIKQLPAELLNRPANWNYAPTFGKPQQTKLVEAKGGSFIIGKSDDSIYGWDNEYGKLEVEVEPFLCGQNLVTNADFLEFVKSDGYKQKEFWSDEAWQWIEKEKVEQPKFWVKRAEGFDYRTVFENVLMPLDYPVEINAHEALAFCRWKGKDWRLLSEAEFVYLAKDIVDKKGEPAISDQYNLNVKYGSPNPVGYLDQENEGVNDLFGNVWDWLSDDFYCLPGFKTHPYYEDFSVPYFDSQHGMMLGGSWATTGTGASSFYRLWFRRHFFQHAGFRLARDL